MNIGIIHYHLKPGGVTTVINQHIRATRDQNDFLIITGENPPDGQAPASVCVIPEIGYDHRDGRPACQDPEATADAVISRLKERWDRGCDVLHIHNPLLAKNARFLKTIKALAAKGQRLLLQIHDFAENGRPGSYYADETYPENCHLAVINTRDRYILIDVGARPEGVHYIANAVSTLPGPEQMPDPEAVVLYPVRAIRRKNIGEAILLSMFFENREALAITLPPNSPVDFPPYNGWRSFCKANGINVLFEASSRHSFPEWVAACRGMISTSITEGFGFAFLEPWTAEKPLSGRKLPDLCADFEAAGMGLDHLYSRLAVPCEWLDRPVLKEKIRRAVAAGHHAYGLPPAGNTMADFLALADRETIDFGMLDETLQKQVIARVLKSPADRQRLILENPFLEHFGHSVKPEAIARNNRVIREKFNEKRCGEQLMAAYRRTVAEPVSHRLDQKRLLSRFFNPDYFSLLQWGEYEND